MSPANSKPAWWRISSRRKWTAQEKQRAIAQESERRLINERGVFAEHAKNSRHPLHPLYKALLAAGAIDIEPLDVKRAWGYGHRKWMIEWAVLEGKRPPLEDIRCTLLWTSDTQWPVLDEAIADQTVRNACLVLLAPDIASDSRLRAQAIIDTCVADTMVKLRRNREDEGARYKAHVDIAITSLPPTL